jgi:hypothetical protein
MNDRKLNKKVWEVIMNRFLKFNKSSLYAANTARLSCVVSSGLRGQWRAWTGILTSAGCEVFPYHFPMEDTEEDIFVRDVALGNIRVPREVAMKIVVLGELP